MSASGHPVLSLTLALVAAIVTAALLLTAPHPAASYDLDAALASVERRATAALQAVHDATTYPQLAEATDEVQAALVEVRDATRHTDEIGDADERRLVRALLAQGKALLTKLSAITSLPDTELSRWESLYAEASHAVTALHGIAAAPAAEDLALAPAALATRAQEALDRVGTLITDARAKLGDWTADVTRLELDRQAQQEALSSYNDAMRPQLDRYAGIRNDSDEFVGRIDTDGANFEEVYGFLDNDRGIHEDIRNVLAGLAPPAAVAGSHAGLLRAMDVAIQQLGAAATGTAEFVWTNGMDRYREAPAWQSFEQMSSPMTTDFDNAMAAWERQMADEQLRLTAIIPPPKPAV